jgi:hypothetical protein
MQAEYDKMFRELIQQRTVIETSYESLTWVNPSHLVPKAGGKLRLVIDMRGVNRFMKPIRFKMEGTPTLKELIVKNDFAVTYDLKEAYNHVPVHRSMQPLLGVAWKGKCYKFLGMPFGLNDAPRVFSRVMRKAIQFIRETWNVRAVIYLDDLILLHQDSKLLKQISMEVTQFLEWLGWTVNQEKSHLDPAKHFKYLGWQWNTEDLTVQLTEERRQKCLESLREARKAVHRHKKITVRGLAKVIGQLSSTRLQYPKASLDLVKMNHMKTIAVHSVGWDGKVMMTRAIISELTRWTTRLKKKEPLTITRPLPVQAIITTDAAPTGWGASLTIP